MQGLDLWKQHWVTSYLHRYNIPGVHKIHLATFFMYKIYWRESPMLTSMLHPIHILSIFVWETLHKTKCCQYTKQSCIETSQVMRPYLTPALVDMVMKFYSSRLEVIRIFWKSGFLPKQLYSCLRGRGIALWKMPPADALRDVADEYLSTYGGSCFPELETGALPD